MTIDDPTIDQWSDREASLFESGRPGDPATVIRRNPKTGDRSMDELVWGLLPHDANPTTCPRPVHARAETVATLSIFADAFRSRRAIVPVDVVSGRGSIGDSAGRRFNFSRDDGDSMALAGLWESFVWPGGRIERSFCVITLPANELMAPIHDRMPVVLERADWPLWLGEEDGDPEALLRAPAPGVLKLVSGTTRRGRGTRHV